MNKYIKIVLLGVVSLGILVGCGNEEKKLVQEAKAEFRILYEYEEDKIRPVIEGEMTEEELARSYLLSRLELSEEIPVYKERGVMKDQGVFLESAIYDGGTIPNITPLSKEVAERIRGEREDYTLERKKKEFEELAANRSKVLDRQYAEDNTGLDEVEEEIKRRVIEHKQDTESPIEEDERVDFDIEE